MKNDKNTFSLVCWLMIMAILSLLAATASQTLRHSLRMSEANTVHAAATEYSALRSIYAEQYSAVPAGASGVNSTSGANVFNTPVR
jgi:Tfp pilus assembly protein PilE